jgi:hypothetical protein
MKLLALIMALVLSGCVYSQIGNRFDISKSSLLKSGVSTEQDARSLFGEPISITTNPQNGHQLLIWQYVYGTALATGGGAKLAISFDASGRMLQIIQEVDLSGTSVARSMPQTANPAPVVTAPVAAEPLQPVSTIPRPANAAEPALPSGTALPSGPMSPCGEDRLCSPQSVTVP